MDDEGMFDEQDDQPSYGPPKDDGLSEKERNRMVARAAIAEARRILAAKAP